MFNEYNSFIGDKLSGNGPLYDDELVFLLFEAGRQLGRLEKFTDKMSSPDYFTYLTLRKEAANLSGEKKSDPADYVKFEAGIADNSGGDTKETENYIKAAVFGFSQLSEMPLSLRMLREVHGILENKNPEFAPDYAGNLKLLDNLEKAIHYRGGISPLIQAAGIYFYISGLGLFEKNNEKTSRLFISLYLASCKILKRPVLMVSEHLNRYFGGDKSEYKGSEIKSFVRAIHDSAKESFLFAEKAERWHREDTGKIKELGCTESNAKIIFESMYETPLISIEDTTKLLNVSIATSGRLLDRMCREGILINLENRKRNKIFVYRRLVDFMKE